MRRNTPPKRIASLDDCNTLEELNQYKKQRGWVLKMRLSKEDEEALMKAHERCLRNARRNNRG